MAKCIECGASWKEFTEDGNPTVTVPREEWDDLKQKADLLREMIDANIRATKAIDFAEAKLIEAKSFMS